MQVAGISHAGCPTHNGPLPHHIRHPKVQFELQVLHQQILKPLQHHTCHGGTGRIRDRRHEQQWEHCHPPPT